MLCQLLLCKLHFGTSYTPMLSKAITISDARGYHSSLTCFRPYPIFLNTPHVLPHLQFDKNLLSLKVYIGKPLLYVKKILPQFFSSMNAACSLAFLSRLAGCVEEEVSGRPRTHFQIDFILRQIILHFSSIINFQCFKIDHIPLRFAHGFC